MEWMVLLAVGLSGVGARRVVTRRAARRDAAEELAAVRHLAEGDVVVFGEQLQRLDQVVGDHPLDADGRHDYQGRWTPTSPRSARWRPWRTSTRSAR